MSGSNRKPGHYWVKYNDWVNKKPQPWFVAEYTKDKDWLIPGDEQAWRERELYEICEEVIPEPAAKGVDDE